jgi:predicted nucleotidyltransferase
MTMNRTWNKYLLEALESDEVELPPLEIRDSLNINIWQSENRIKPEISSRLIQIAMDFLDSLDIHNKDIEDIILTGSLANYNWTDYSDLDLHVILDFSRIDDNVKLVKDFFNAKKSDWNKTHQIMIKSHEVEIYLQDVREPHVSTGVYSLLEDEWAVKPNREKPKIDRKSIKVKTKSIMDQIDRVEELVEKNNYEAAYNVANLIRDKIKRLRRCGLVEKGIFSIENLVFKTLRSSEYMGKLLDLRTKAYDKMMSLNHNVV